MRIDPKLASAMPLRAGGPRPAASGTFRIGSGSEAGQASAARSAASLASLDAILALQVEEDPRERRGRSARRGRELLDALDELKAALLGDRAPAELLGRLARRLDTGAGSSGDPALDEIVASIELRAKVELAKLGRNVTLSGV